MLKGGILKEKYLVKESNGWQFKGKLYLEGQMIELTKSQYDTFKSEVKLQPVTKQ